MAKIFTDCPVEYTASLIANKWKIIILRELLTGTKRYNELTRNVVGISAKVLTENLSARLLLLVLFIYLC